MFCEKMRKDRLTTLILALLMLLTVFSGCSDEDADNQIADNNSVTSQYSSSSQDNNSSIDSMTDALTVPNFIGLMYSEMVEDSRYSDFNITVLNEFNDKVPVGKIFYQSCKEGRVVQKNAEIVIKVSKGTETVTIPNVKGLNVLDAKIKLKSVGIEFNEIFCSSSSVAENFVIMTNPPEGDIDQGDVIELYISTGPDKVFNTVDNYTKLTKDAAIDKIEGAGFVAEIIELYDGSVKDVVIKQTPEPGTLLERGSTIQIFVGTGAISHG